MISNDIMHLETTTKIEKYKFFMRKTLDRCKKLQLNFDAKVFLQKISFFISILSN